MFQSCWIWHFCWSQHSGLSLFHTSGSVCHTVKTSCSLKQCLFPNHISSLFKRKEETNEEEKKCKWVCEFNKKKNNNNLVDLQCVCTAKGAKIWKMKMWAWKPKRKQSSIKSPRQRRTRTRGERKANRSHSVWRQYTVESHLHRSRNVCKYNYPEFRSAMSI